MIIVNDRIKRRFVGRSSAEYNPTKNLKILGSVKMLGNALTTPTPIVLIDSIGLNVVQKTMSNKNGDYKFEWLTAKPHIVIATRTTKDFNAVIQDNVVPK